ncbi:MAG: DUF975 family protein [Solobacterium sp.]|nr:DUF975 family protein [Solobacterium sp.]
MNNQEIRVIAKDLYKQKYWMAVIVALFAGIVNILMTYNGASHINFTQDLGQAISITTTVKTGFEAFKDTVISLLQIFVQPLIYFYVGAWFLANLRNESEPDIVKIFNPSLAVNIILANFLRFLKAIVYSIPLVIGVVVFAVFYEAKETSIAALVALLILVLIIMIGILLIRYFYSTSMIFYLLRDNPEMSAFEAIRESKRLMKGKRFDLFKLEFGFIGWILLGIFTCGLVMIFIVNPWMQQSKALFYDELIQEEYRKQIIV